VQCLKAQNCWKIQERTQKCLLRYAKLNILSTEKPLKFSVYNYCLLNVTEGNKIFDLMMTEGIQWYNITNIIHLVMPRECVKHCKLMDNLNVGEQLLLLELTVVGKELKEIVAAGG